MSLKNHSTPRRCFLRSSLLASALVIAPLAAQATVIVNGDFEAGDTGFTSTYTYVSPGAGALVPPAVYTVDDDASDSHGLFFPIGDHTTGSGNMMIINGSLTTGIAVWQGTVNVDLVVGEQYDFSAWVASVLNQSAAQLTFSVDGVTLGTLSPDLDGSWKRLFTTFTAQDVRPTFTLINSNAAFGGNDFAIDDIDVFYAGTTIPPGTGVPDAGPGMLSLAALAGLLAFRRRR